MNDIFDAEDTTIELASDYWQGDEETRRAILAIINPLDFICEPVFGRRKELIERIYSNCKVEDHGFTINGKPSPCLIWQGSDTGKPRENGDNRHVGYPKMSLEGQKVRVHRVVFMNFAGFIPPQKQVDHRCGVRLCVRFEHLRSATQKQNSLWRDIKNGVVRRKRRRKRRAK